MACCSDPVKRTVKSIRQANSERTTAFMMCAVWVQIRREETVSLSVCVSLIVSLFQSLQQPYASAFSAWVRPVTSPKSQPSP